MKTKEALIYVKMCCSDGLQLPQNQSLEQVKLIGASIETIEQNLNRLENLEKENQELKEENKILKEGIKSLLNYCDDLYLYEEKPYHITEEGIIHTFFDYEKEDLEKIKLMFEVLENE